MTTRIEEALDMGAFHVSDDGLPSRNRANVAPIVSAG
jgi:hypothetical protein